MANFSAYLIGSDTLLIECCQMLTAAGHDVRGIITDAPRLNDWATEHDVPSIAPQDLVAELGAAAYDYLFAVTWLHILPDEVISTARKGAINFHDGPLPRYAGLNAPAWALMNGEAEYGITWHAITPGVDEGDILVQNLFEIAPNESSLSLNTRCFEAAIDGFDTLIGQLAEDSLQPTPQSLSERSYYGRHDKPAAAGVIDFDQPAETIAALIAATDFGPYANLFASAKARCKGQWFVLGGVELTDDKPSGRPGTITVAGEAILVACADVNLRFHTVTHLDGHPALADLHEGLVFEGLSATEAATLTERNTALSRAEAFWTQRLTGVDPVEAPFSGRSGGMAGTELTPVDLGSDAQATAIFVALMARLTRANAFSVGLNVAEPDATVAGLTAPQVPLQVRFDPGAPFADFATAFEREVKAVNRRGTYLTDLVARTPELSSQAGLPIALSIGETIPTRVAGSTLTFAQGEDGKCALAWDTALFSANDANRLVVYLQTMAASFAADPDKPAGQLGLLPAAEEQALRVTVNATGAVAPPSVCVHQAFEAQVERTPYATAMVFRSDVINYLNLNARANQLAHHLVKAGIGPDDLVGVHIERSLDMMVAIMGVLKAGAAFVPMDPDFPRERLEYIFSSAGSQLLLTQEKLKADAPVPADTTILCIDADWGEIRENPGENPVTTVSPENLAYVIYTSGSTGRPKGVMIEHRNVANFFLGMDDCIPHAPGDSWLAVTSLSFDISILELFWTLSHGMKLVLFKDDERAGDDVPLAIRQQKMDFSLFLWGSDGSEGANKYQLMLDAARFADKNQFSAVWTPERHFNNWGGPYPNPSVTGAAIAAVTDNVDIRAGSCVVPLHHPIRIAEDWSIVDNLSGGRAGIAAASGWQPADFVIRPESFANNKKELFENIDRVQKLWRGEKVTFAGVDGKPVEVATQPRPIQPSLPVWITSAGSVETFIRAGETGNNLLTHLLGQSVEQVAEKIAAYRKALVDAGFDPATRTVTVMLHTLVGENTADVREAVREPLKDYLRGSVSLLADNVWAFPTFRRPGDTSSSLTDIDISTLDEADVDAIVDFSFERYFNQSGLFGTPERCMAMINKLKAIGVTEVGCLIDYGVENETMLASLPMLASLLQQANAESTSAGQEFSFTSLVSHQDITHFQCTPSMARMLAIGDESRAALASIKHLMIGGEALPLDLAHTIKAEHDGTLTNMYGPTETTIWSSTQVIGAGAPDIPIGRPIANTRMYVLDDGLQLLPAGIPGDLYIGGAGVARGYKGRDDLTVERFIDDPFVPGERIYKTGDLARLSADGVFEYLGRSDFQVKIRGFRIELGEIELALMEHSSVSACVVHAAEFAPDDVRLVGYIVPAAGGYDDEALRTHLRDQLPEYMVPANFVQIPRIPQTPNGKVDRNALPKPIDFSRADRPVANPESDTESQILEIWKRQLALESISVDEPFFDVGGNSLLLVAVHREIRKFASKPVMLTDLYRFPTVRSIAAFLESDGGGDGSETGKKRGEARRQRQARRRR